MTRARDDGEIVWLASRTHRAVHAIEALLSTVCDREDVIGLADLTVGERCSQPGLAAVVPGGLDQQAAGEHRTGLGDRAPWREDSPDWFSDGASTRATPRARARCLETLPVRAELEVQRERGQRVDPPECSEPGNGRPPALVGSHLREPQRDRHLA